MARASGREEKKQIYVCLFRFGDIGISLKASNKNTFIDGKGERRQTGWIRSTRHTKYNSKRY